MAQNVVFLVQIRFLIWETRIVTVLPQKTVTKRRCFT